MLRGSVPGASLSTAVKPMRALASPPLPTTFPPDKGGLLAPAAQKPSWQKARWSQGHGGPLTAKGHAGLSQGQPHNKVINYLISTGRMLTKKVTLRASVFLVPTAASRRILTTLYTCSPHCSAAHEVVSGAPIFRKTPIWVQ